MKYAITICFYVEQYSLKHQSAIYQANNPHAALENLHLWHAEAKYVPPLVIYQSGPLSFI